MVSPDSAARPPTVSPSGNDGDPGDSSFFGPRESFADLILERALRTPVIGRKNFYGSGAEWAAHLAADVWTVTATAARHGIEPLSLLTGYLQECARNGGTAPAGALSPFLPWTPQGRRRRPASDPGPGS